MELTSEEAKKFRRGVEKKYYALTGSHRIAAAQLILDKVPVVILGPKGKQAVINMWLINRDALDGFFPCFYPSEISNALWKARCKAVARLAIQG